MAQRIFQAGVMRLSGLEVRPSGPPKAIVLALHGGGYLAGYWDYPGGSLLELAARRGMLGLAIDRPGYGAAKDKPCNLSQQAEIVLDLIEALRRAEGGVPLLLAGHSMGGILSLMIAANARSSLIAAIDVCGVPLVFPDHMLQAFAARTVDPAWTHYPPAPAEHVRALFYGPDGTFEPEALAYDAKVSAPVPVAEFPDAATAPRTLPQIMPRITLPVRYSMSEFEASSRVDEEVAALAREGLRGSRRAEVRIQPATGHNISLHRVGGDFHRQMLDSFEAVIA